MNAAENVKVWDPVVRIFHWSLVGAFTTAWISGEDWLTVHAYAGYLVLGLVVFRIFWGFLGTRHARFSDFVRPWPDAIAYLKDVMTLRAKRYLGHNPAGGAMIMLLLVTLIATSVTGIVVYGIEDQAGPLAGWVAGLGEAWEEIFEETHELLANFTLLLVFVHVAGVLVESLLHRENLVRAMIDGNKRIQTSTVRDS